MSPTSMDIFARDVSPPASRTSYSSEVLPMKDGDGVYWMEPSAVDGRRADRRSGRDRDGQRVTIDVAIVREGFEARRQPLHRPHGVRDAGGRIVYRPNRDGDGAGDRLGGPIREQVGRP